MTLTSRTETLNSLSKADHQSSVTHDRTAARVLYFSAQHHDVLAATEQSSKLIASIRSEMDEVETVDSIFSSLGLEGNELASALWCNVE